MREKIRGVLIRRSRGDLLLDGGIIDRDMFRHAGKGLQFKELDNLVHNLIETPFKISRAGHEKPESGVCYGQTPYGSGPRNHRRLCNPRTISWDHLLRGVWKLSGARRSFFDFACHISLGNREESCRFTNEQIGRPAYFKILYSHWKKLEGKHGMSIRLLITLR